MNIDSLIDYILYRGPVFTSRMSTFTHLLAFGPLVRKAVICASLLYVLVILEYISSSKIPFGKHGSRDNILTVNNQLSLLKVRYCQILYLLSTLSP